MKRLLLLLTCLIPFSLSADTNSDNYRLPAELTGDDWDLVNNTQSDYHACLQKKMIEFGANSDDPRVISDQVLDICSIILLKLDRDMAERNIHPGFTQRYIYNMKNKAAQKLLRSLMIMIAGRQQQNEAEALKDNREDADKATN